MVFMEKNNPKIPSFAINGINLASPRLKSDVIYATDDFFADKNRLIKKPLNKNSVEQKIAVRTSKLKTFFVKKNIPK